MTLPTHIALGMIIGKVTGNYPAAITASVLVDLDHLQSYILHGVIFKPKKLWSTLTDQVDQWGDQRGIFHNVLFFTVVSIPLVFFAGMVGIIIIAGYFGHLVLDALDNSDYWPLYPNKKINLKGSIKYGTWQELIFFVILIIIFIVI